MRCPSRVQLVRWRRTPATADCTASPLLWWVLLSITIVPDCGTPYLGFFLWRKLLLPLEMRHDFRFFVMRALWRVEKLTVPRLPPLPH